MNSMKYNLGGDPVMNLKSILSTQLLEAPLRGATNGKSTYSLWTRDAADFETTHAVDGESTSFYASEDEPSFAIGSSDHLHSLLRQQDEYIVQLELESNTLKNELKNIRTTARLITDENQRIIQNWKMDIFSHLLPKKEEKGISDEEKVFYNQGVNDGQKATTSSCVDHETRIKQLENELNLLRQSQESTEKATEIPAGEQYKIIILKKEWDDLLERNAQFRQLVNDLKSREDEAQNQIKKGIQLVEEAHLQKAQAMIESEQLKNDLTQLRKQTGDMRNEYDRKLQDEHSRTMDVEKQKIDKVVNELTIINQTLDSTRLNLERTIREKRELERQLEVTQRQNESITDDLIKTIAKLRESETKLRLERDGAIRDLSQMKTTRERSKQEQFQEMNLLKSKLSDTNVRMKRMEDDYLDAKRQVAGMIEKTFHLETQIRQYELQRQLRDSGLIRHPGKVSFTDGDSVRTYEGMERVIEQQMRLVNGFRDECKRLATQQDQLDEHNKQSGKMLKKENEILSQKLLALNEKYKQLEMISLEKEKQHRDIVSKLQSMKAEIERQNQQVINLLQRQTELLKEREFLHGEMRFLHDKVKL